MGAILSQKGEDEVEHLVCYASRSCNAAEQNYSSFDGECLAVVWATSQFRSYLFGNSSTLVTDHEPLKWLLTTQKLTGTFVVGNRNEKVMLKRRKKDSRRRQKVWKESKERNGKDDGRNRGRN